MREESITEGTTQLTYHRLFPFGVVTSGLTLIFLLIILILAGRRLLIPGVILLGSFILFVLWLTTLIETSIQLFGPSGNVNANCNTYVTGQEFRGISVETLAWLTQSNICSCWKAVFSWALIATSKFLPFSPCSLSREGSTNTDTQYCSYGCKF